MGIFDSATFTSSDDDLDDDLPSCALLYREPSTVRLGDRSICSSFPQTEPHFAASTPYSVSPKCKRMTNLGKFALVTNLELHFPPAVRESSRCPFDDSAKEVT